MEPTALFETVKRRRPNERRWCCRASVRLLQTCRCGLAQTCDTAKHLPSRSRASGVRIRVVPHTRRRTQRHAFSNFCCTPAASPRSCVTETLLKFPEGACCSCDCNCELRICLFDFFLPLPARSLLSPFTPPTSPSTSDITTTRHLLCIHRCIPFFPSFRTRLLITWRRIRASRVSAAFVVVDSLTSLTFRSPLFQNILRRPSTTTSDLWTYARPSDIH